LAGGVMMEVEVKGLDPIIKAFEIINELLADERIPLEIRQSYEERLQEVLDSDYNN
jgi:uncharacterized protein (UPF0147 family)